MIAQVEGTIATEHIMWQPMFNCVKGCRGCYVAPHISTAIEKPSLDIYKEVYIKKRIKCNQFTVSLDSVNSPPDTQLLMTLEALFGSLEEGDPELCVTAFDWKTVKDWARWLCIGVEELLAPLSILSLSHFPAGDGEAASIRRLCDEAKVILNYNFRPTGRKLTEQITCGVLYSHQIYLVYDKQPLGEEQSLDKFALWRHWNRVIKEQGFISKLVKDACLTDSVRYLSNNLTCGAAITKVHVWPDGSVTGCPYDSHQVSRRSGVVPGELYSTWEEMNREMFPSTPCMDHCKIPDMLEEALARHQKLARQKQEKTE